MFVYVINAGPRTNKIGLSKSAEVRLGTLQTAHHTTLRLAYVREVENAAAVERYAHIALGARRLRGEWFNVREDEARAAVDLAAEAVARGEFLPAAVVEAPAEDLVSRPPEAEPGYCLITTVEEGRRRREINDEMYRRLVAPRRGT